jgi:ABC-type uncharacterized transport system auxiliary subunit
VSTSRRLAVLCVAAAAVALGGCRGTVPTASPADPLSSVETRVDQIEKQIDQDGGR